MRSSPTRSGTRTPQGYRPQYRLARELPYELKEQCIIYFEEALYAQALNLLSSLVAAGGTCANPGPAYVPPHQFLALACTLIVHPSLTTRSKSPEKLQAANLALKYLRLVHRLVGPLNANFYDAFTFTGSGTVASRRGGGLRRRVVEDGSPTRIDSDSVNSELANTNGLWVRADDFWHAVGWAFNCSVAHKKRWERWRLWLEFIIGVLEDDLESRDEDRKEESLIIRYLSAGNGMLANEKRVLRAVFADGSTRSLSEFKEIWKNETKDRKPKDDLSNAKVLSTTPINIDEDNYGDYLLDSSSSSEIEDSVPRESANSPPPPHQTSTSTSSLPDGSLPLGGSTALSLRLRLLSLLNTVSQTHPSSFTSITTLYDLLLTHIRPLLLPTFSLLISPPSLRIFSPHSPCAASTLTQYLLRSLISSAAPFPGVSDDLSQEVLERCYLPFPANTMSVTDNVKVSLCVESLLRILDREVGVVWGEGLVRAVEVGIEAREEKAKRDGRRKGEGGGAGAGAGAGVLGVEGEKMRLRASASRIRGVVEMAKGEGEGEDEEA